MIVVTCLLAIALVVIVVAFLHHYRERERLWQQVQQEWAAERRELANRIQRPEHIPVGVSRAWVAPEPEDDEVELVGTIADPPQEAS